MIKSEDQAEDFCYWCGMDWGFCVCDWDDELDGDIDGWGDF